jgi:hypothetical protein
MRFGLDEVPSAGGMVTDHGALPAVGGVAPHPRLLPMKQVGQHLAVMHIRRRGRQRMDQLGPLSTPRCAFMPKYHWLPFFV